MQIANMTWMTEVADLLSMQRRQYVPYMGNDGRRNNRLRM